MVLFESWCWLAAVIAWQRGYRAEGRFARVPWGDEDPVDHAATELEDLARTFCSGAIVSRFEFSGVLTV